ncbi:MAG TPA: DEAD/DEAH box helicase [Microthrixaceae bacterium]|nr:DEAD/DEAH box helicase [Microthrixaceae bacterium]
MLREVGPTESGRGDGARLGVGPETGRLGAGLHLTLLPAEVGRASQFALWSELDVADDGPAALGAPGVDAGHTRVELVVPADDGVERTMIPAHVASVAEVLDDLAQLAPDAEASRSARAWAQVTRVALDLVARGRIHAAAAPDEVACWVVGPLDSHDRAVRAALAGWLPPEAHCTPIDDSTTRVVAPIRAVSALYDAVADLLPRTTAAEVLGAIPFASRELRSTRGLSRAVPAVHERDRTVIGLRVELPSGDDDHFRVVVQLRSPHDPDLTIDADDWWNGAAGPEGPTLFGVEAETDLLLALRRGSTTWAPLTRLLAEPRPAELELADDEAMDLFGPMATDLGSAGLEVLVPASLTRAVRATAHATAPPGSTDGPARFDLSALCELSWRATLDGEPLSADELAVLATAHRPIVRLRDEWVVVDQSVVSKLARRDRLTVAEVLSAALAGSVVVDDAPVVVEPTGGLADLAARLRLGADRNEAVEPELLETELRPYQRRGLAWLDEMTALGLGGVLADDMGLGKTVQLIALHLKRLEADASMPPTLVICPATVVSNWEHELARFAPSLRVHRYHGPERELSGIEAGDVVVTTYGIARRDHVRLATQPWGIVAADEAQQVKNPNASTARALRTIPADARVALTGTPVENRLTELWALVDWTTPGLLGDVETFRRTFAIPIERDGDPDATGRLGRLVAPFVLRRRKDDPEIVPDLPPKIETDAIVALSAEQAGLYRATTDEILSSISRAEGIERRGLVLKLLTALKQICNHPAHYLRETGPLAARSGKLDAFDDLVPAIAEAGDAALVFTQYVAMGDLLVERLGQLGLATGFLHGGLSLPRRAELVDRFQSGGFPVFVISLKAGGTGLNLTRATHVIHYDRWWNPAVENQASDRAWRIGQTRTVQIHRMISEGTVEERIAAVLAEKATLADAVIGTGEAWISELDDDALADLVQLSEESR